jgi:hypothetical protein
VGGRKPSSIEGSGVKMQRIPEPKPKQVPNKNKIVVSKKFYVDKGKLRDGFLTIKYIKTNGLTPLGNYRLTPLLRNVITDMIETGKFRESEYKQLQPQEQDLIHLLVKKYFDNIDYKVDNDDAWLNELNILIGETMVQGSQSTNDILKRLVKMLNHGVQTKRLTQFERSKILNELNL